jgi:hypothetical protein
MTAPDKGRSTALTNQADLSTTELKSRLAALLRQGHADERSFGDTLSQEERERTGTVDAWAAKEIIAHLAYWRERETERVQALARGEAPPPFEDYERMNTESFTDLAEHSWEMAIARSHRATEDLIAAIERLPDSILAGSAHVAEKSGPVMAVTTIIGNGYQHPLQHLAEMSAVRGDMAGSSAIQRRMLDAVIALGAGASVNASARYNLACALVSTGPREEVIALLRQSFADNPRLIAWSRQDTDLDPLRDDPDYQALTAEEQG